MKQCQRKVTLSSPNSRTPTARTIMQLGSFYFKSIYSAQTPYTLRSNPKPMIYFNYEPSIYGPCFMDGSKSLYDEKVISMFGAYKRELLVEKLNDFT